MKNKISIAIFGLFLVGTLTYAALPTHIHQQLNDFLTELMQKLTAFNAEAPEDRVYAHFDKTLYKPGETIWFAAYIRDGKTLEISEMSDIVNVQLINRFLKKFNLIINR